MPLSYENVERDGMKSLINLAKALCRIVFAFAAIIQGKYGDNPAIMALLVACQALCPLIADAENAAITMTGDNTVPLDTPEQILGINPGRPDATGILALVPDQPDETV